ncbi:miniconductance mechanosensitive channel YbdG [Spirochaetota bacterium]|nr:miniconductance mechanosensitive channel YbdG [Spirochaetota bacterium]
MKFLEQFFYLSGRLSDLNYDLLLLGILVLVIGLVIKVTQWVIIPLLEKLINLSESKADDKLIYTYFIPALKFAPSALIVIYISQFFKFIPAGFFIKTGKTVLVFVIVVILTRIIDDIVEITKKVNVSEKLHLRGISQAVKLIIYLLGGIFIISILIDQTPWALLGGLGALTAVVLLVFRDVILGLVAGIQLSANNMVKIGDWIEIPEHGVDGSVIDILLTTVKIENWDKSITFLPAHVLISKSFKNWRRMQDLGVRRIKRDLYININSIRFLSPLDIDKYKAIPQLKKFFSTENASQPKHHTSVTKLTVPPKDTEFAAKLQDTASSALYSSTYTTAGLFRSYAIEYLLSHPKIRNNLTVLARMMPPTAKGMGLQLYCFTDTANFLEYESIQSSIFEHLIATAELLGLAIFQDPSGLDMQKLYSHVSDAKREQ